MTDCRTAAVAVPGVDTLRVVAAVDPAALSPAGLVDAVIASERLLAYVNGLQVALLAELGRPNRCADVSGLVAALVDKTGAGRGPNGRVDPVGVVELTADRSIGVAAAEVAAVLDWSPVTAGIRIRQAMRMTADLPATAAALLAGRVDVGRARMIVDRTAVLSPGLSGGVERRVLPLVRGRSKARLETLVDREVIAADPAAAEQRRLAAVRDRSVSHRPDKDGMGVITALLPAEAAVMVFTLVDLIAAANKGLDGRSVDQRRADAIADIADELLTFGFVDLDGLVARAESADQPGTHAEAPRAAEPDDEPDADEAADDADADAANDAEPAADADAGATDAEPAAHEAADANADAAATAAEPAAHEAADADVDDDGTDALAGAAVGVVAGIRETAAADRAGRLARAVTRHGRRPHLTVTGAWTTLAGLDDLPGHLDGHGTITAGLLRAIAKSWGTVTAVGVDPASGTATAVGGLTYRAGRRICDQVILLSGTCRAAGCRMPAAKCDLDHVVPFDHTDPAAGGRTVLGNQLPYCRFHHLLKHHAHWTPQLRADMTVVWTTATGHTAVSYPREFTAPGEWHRAAGPAVDTNMAVDTNTATATATAAGVDDGRGGALPGPGAATTDPPGERRSINAEVSVGAPGRQVIIGPAVFGPTIPVIPAGTDYQEPHTDLEDPASIPHPGSVEINTYRALREDTRRHALHRIRRLTPADPDPSPAAVERAELDRAYRIAQAFRDTESGSDTDALTPRPTSLRPDLTDITDPLREEPPF